MKIVETTMWLYTQLSNLVLHMDMIIQFYEY